MEMRKKKLGMKIIFACKKQENNCWNHH